MIETKNFSELHLNLQLGYKGSYHEAINRQRTRREVYEFYYTKSLAAILDNPPPIYNQLAL